jgi:two-component system, LytTR family, sensor histidine kinase AlgZ
MNLLRVKKTGHFIFWVGWIFFGLVLAALFSSATDISRWHIFEFAAMLSGIAQVSAWSAIFSCKTAPLSRTPSWRLLLTHIVAAIALTFLWIKLGGAIARGMDGIASWHGIAALYGEKTAALYAASVFFYLLGVAFQYALIERQSSREALARAGESEVRARDAELSALKAQINPHFLYNSLNSISALTTIDPARAREMCVLLADFLRATLGVGEKRAITLREELGLLEKYFSIEKIRFGERLTLQENIQEDAKACLLPPLLLQPLVENAVVHGIAQMAEGGWIRLSAVRNKDILAVTVENSWDPEAHSTRRNGVGLKNVQRRMETSFGKDAHLQANAEDEIFRVTLAIPVQLAEAV